MRKLFILFLLLDATPDAKSQITPLSGLQKLKWLQGAWKGSAGAEPFYEGWRFYNDSILVNFAIEIKGRDTVIKESSALVLRNGQLTLGQKPAQWAATPLTANELVLRHDTLKYSNTIIWLHTKEDHWFTILEHPRSTVYYDMSRDPVLDEKLEMWIRQHRKKD